MRDVNVTFLGGSITGSPTGVHSPNVGAYTTIIIYRTILIGNITGIYSDVCALLKISNARFEDNQTDLHINLVRKIILTAFESTGSTKSIFLDQTGTASLIPILSILNSHIESTDPIVNLEKCHVLDISASGFYISYKDFSQYDQFEKGFSYYDSTFNKPLWFNKAIWTDSNGTAI